MAVTGLFGVQCGCGLVCVTTVISLLMKGAISQERDIAYRSPRGALLCPLGEEFYSYKRTASYGPSRWGEISECCQGQKQSPRDLSSSSPSLCGRGQPTMFSYSSNRTLPGKLYNNGHDPTISFHGHNTARLSNVPYTSGAYVLHNIHLHFCTDAKGSEHAIDGKFFQSEIHLVHYKASYGSLAKAVLKEDGLVVIGIMLQTDRRRASRRTGRHAGRQTARPQDRRKTAAGYRPNVNQEMVKIIRKMGSLEGTGKEFELPIQVNVAGIFPRSKSFYTYDGSMTSPPCSESVRWVIFREPISVSRNEMDILRRLPNEDRSYIAQSCNDRPLQNGHTRVETNFACSAQSKITEEEI